MTKKKFYITTPLYYVNAEPHIGHAYTTLAADILSRYKRMKGQDVHFLTGTDEHGANIEKIAAAKGVTPKQWVDDIAEKFRVMWTDLNVRYDDFIRTTQPRHEEAVKIVFEKLLEKGDIYKGHYEGLYCYPCENYWEEKDLLEGNLCPMHKKPVVPLKEETYFFKLSKYGDALLAYYKEHPEFMVPKHRSQEIINFVKEGLTDISVSRSKVAWGITVKSDPAHTIYVWFEALLNYATAIGLGHEISEHDEQKSSFKTMTHHKFTDYWPADYHLMGKEIYRFHTIIWPAMLMALELPLPKQVFAHGWWTVNGQKMSKSCGNFINPSEVIAEYGVDPLRYFLFREVPFGSDGDFSMAAFRQRYNSDLANDLGNLLNRLTNMAVKYLDGNVPEPLPENALVKKTSETVLKYEAHMEKLEFDQALCALWALISELNRAIEREQPWAKAKTEPEKLPELFGGMIYALREITARLAPFMPDTTVKITDLLGKKGDRVQKGAPLFPRLLEEKAEAKP
ncbi:MAG: methionine--tRNA ligase [Elusimicrobiaceae bacterium]